VPRHGTSPLGCRALWHGTALSKGFSAVPGPESGHGGTTRHGTAPCLIVPCLVMLVPCSASAARLVNYRTGGDGVEIGEGQMAAHEVPSCLEDCRNQLRSPEEICSLSRLLQPRSIIPCRS